MKNGKDYEQVCKGKIIPPPPPTLLDTTSTLPATTSTLSDITSTLLVTTTTSEMYMIEYNKSLIILSYLLQALLSLFTPNLIMNNSEDFEQVRIESESDFEEEKEEKEKVLIPPIDDEEEEMGKRLGGMDLENLMMWDGKREREKERERQREDELREGVYRKDLPGGHQPSSSRTKLGKTEG